MSSRAYVVRQLARGEWHYLVLEGPFQYPRWKPTLSDVEPMTFVRAHQCASAFGADDAEVVLVFRAKEGRAA